MGGGKKMERETGLEPATSTLARLRSTNWAIPALSYKDNSIIFFLQYIVSSALVRFI